MHDSTSGNQSATAGTTAQTPLPSLEQFLKSDTSIALTEELFQSFNLRYIILKNYSALYQFKYEQGKNYIIQLEEAAIRYDDKDTFFIRMHTGYLTPLRNFERYYSQTERREIKDPSQLMEYIKRYFPSTKLNWYIAAEDRLLFLKNFFNNTGVRQPTNPGNFETLCTRLGHPVQNIFAINSAEDLLCLLELLGCVGNRLQFLEYLKIPVALAPLPSTPFNPETGKTLSILGELLVAKFVARISIIEINCQVRNHFITTGFLPSSERQKSFYRAQYIKQVELQQIPQTINLEEQHDDSSKSATDLKQEYNASLEIQSNVNSLWPKVVGWMLNPTTPKKTTTVASTYVSASVSASLTSASASAEPASTPSSPSPS